MPIKTIARTLGDQYIRFRTRQEFEGNGFRWVNERPVEYAYVFRMLNELQPVTVLDVGTGTSALPSLLATCGFLCTATDNVADYWPEGMLNRHWHIVDDDIRATRLEPESFDAVLCISTLEHIPEHRAAVANMLRLTKSGGHVLITAPYNERTYHPNVYRHSEALYGQDLPYVCQSFSRAEVDAWMEGTEAEILDQQYWCGWTGPLWDTGAQVRPIERAGVNEPHQLTCMTIRKG